MDKINFVYFETFGTISNINKYEITVEDDTQDKTYAVEANNNYDPNLYIGESIVVTTYRWDTPFDFIVAINGIIDRKAYDNAIRTSQRIPKGWICKPKVELIETFGTIECTDGDDSYRPIDCSKMFFNDSKELLPLGDYHSFELYTNHEEAVAQIYTITYPNGNIEEYKRLLPKKKYDKCLNGDKIRK